LEKMEITNWMPSSSHILTSLRFKQKELPAQKMYNMD